MVCIVQYFLLKTPSLVPCLVLFALELLILQREFSSLKEKEDDHGEGGSTIMFLQLFSADCWSAARTVEHCFKAVCQGSGGLCTPIR